MPRHPKYDVLFEPLSIGPKVMRNRFYQVPHCANFGVDYPATHARFRSTKAEGGWAVVNTEYCSIHPESDDKPRIATQLWDESDVQNTARLCEEIHGHDALAGVELWYGAAHAPNYDSRIPARGVSQIPSDYVGFTSSCYEMDVEEIHELQQFYCAAAVRARDAGFDVVNVYGGQCASITQQFLDPFYNKRTDGYGGSFENRARFWLELLEMVRNVVGKDCAIACRIGADTNRPTGLGIEESCRFVTLADELVDLWDITLSNGVDWSIDVAPSRIAPEHFQREWLEAIRPYTRKPLVGVGRFVNPDTMAAAVSSGLLDVIGAARPSIADPFLPRKVEEGRPEDIRECIGCNMCISRVWGTGSRLVCTQNPTIGEEYRRGWHPERVSVATNAENDVLVIGAGPAGLQCAMILGKRGMRRIHLVDSHGEVGGSMRWIPRLPGLGEWGRVVDYRNIQIQKLRNVQFVPNSKADYSQVAEYGAEIVVLAVGSRWAENGLNAFTHSPISGFDAQLAWQSTPDQLMEEGKEATDRVLIYDTDGYFMAPAVAQLLAERGATVTLVTPLGSIAPYSAFTGEQRFIYRTLASLKVEMVTSVEVTSVDADGTVHGCGVVLRDRERVWSTDSLVMVTHRISRVDLWRQLRTGREQLSDEGVIGLFRVGDCVVPRTIADAVFDGHRLAMDIDTPNPAVHSAYLRENLVLESGAGVNV